MLESALETGTKFDTINPYVIDIKAEAKLRSLPAESDKLLQRIDFRLSNLRWHELAYAGLGDKYYNAPGTNGESLKQMGDESLQKFRDAVSDLRFLLSTNTQATGRASR